MKAYSQKAYLYFLLLLCFPINLLAQQDTLFADSIYYDGKDFYSAGDYLAASASLQRALNLYKDIYGEKHERVMKAYFHLGRAERKNINYKAAILYEQKSLEIAEEIFGYYSEDVGYTLQAIGNIYDKIYNPEKSSWYFNESIKVFKKVYGEESQEVGGAYMNLGLSDLDKGMYQNAHTNFQKALKCFTVSSEPDSKAFNKIYINLSYLYRQLGDYDKAIEYGEKALVIKLKNYDELHPSVSKYYGNIGRNYQLIGDYEKSLPYSQKMVELSTKSVGPDHHDTGASYTSLGNVYAGLGDYQKSLALFQKAIGIMEKKLEPNHPSLINAHINLGKIYEDDLKDYDKALDIYQAMLASYSKRDYLEKKYIASTKRIIANVLLKKGEIDLALKTIQEGIQSLCIGFSPKDDDFYSNPSPKQSQLKLDLLKHLYLKSKILDARFEKNKETEDLKQALETIELSIEIIELMRKSYLSESSRQFLNTKTASIFERAVEQAFKLYHLTKDTKYLSKAFRISEQSRASILWQSLNERYAFQASNISSKELDKLNILQLKIANEEEKINGAQDKKDIDFLQNKIFDLKQTYEQTITKLEASNPKYYQLKYAANNLTPNQIIKNIPNDHTLLIEYFYTDKQIFIFVFSKKEFKGFQIPITFDLKDKILALRKNDVQRMIFKQSSTLDYRSNINTLYELLIQPIAAEIKQSKNLIIIPHGILQLLSFETLAPSSNSKDFRTLDYLLKTHNIHYAWSASLWAERPSHKTNNTLGFTGFAPGFKLKNQKQLAHAGTSNSRADETELSHSIPEIENAVSFFPGKTFIDTEASESHFLEWAPQSRIIHLATHGVANDRHPLESGLLFSENNDTLEDGFLNTLEIYNLNLSADLAVMSACNTGYGQLAEGEGIMSLGRAFMYAGCKSVISSLWLANDESTSSIMQGFYKYSSEGLSKDEALRNAKIDYLNQADPLTSHPYFWANLVVVGDMTSLQLKGGSSLWWIILIIISSLLFSVFIFKKISH